MHILQLRKSISPSLNKMAHLHLADQPVGPVLYLHGIRKRFHVPEGLEVLMDELSRHVLRHQPEPEKMYEFISDFLDRKLEGRRVAEAEAQARKESGDGRRRSLEWRTWSTDGPSILSDDELKEFVGQFRIPFEAAEHLATIIQAAYRGFQARKEYKELTKSNKRRKEILWEEWLHEGKFFAEGSDIHQILLHYGLTLAEANQFATKIQAVFRGHLARKSIAEVDPVLAQHLEELGITKKEATKHAITLQTFYRGHRARQELKDRAGKLIVETNAETQSALELEEQERKETEEREAKRAANRKSTPSLLEQLQERSKPKLSISKQPPKEVKAAEHRGEGEEAEEYEGEGEEILTDLDYLTAVDLAVHVKHRHHKHPRESSDKSQTAAAHKRDSMARAKEQYIAKANTYEWEEEDEDEEAEGEE